MPATFEENVAAYEKMKDRLEDEHFLQWAVFHDGELVGIYDDGLTARREAWMRFHLDPYLIRAIGDENVEKKRQHLVTAIEHRRRHGKD